MDISRGEYAKFESDDSNFDVEYPEDWGIIPIRVLDANEPLYMFIDMSSIFSDKANFFVVATVFSDVGNF